MRVGIKGSRCGASSVSTLSPGSFGGSLGEETERIRVSSIVSDFEKIRSLREKEKKRDRQREREKREVSAQRIIAPGLPQNKKSGEQVSATPDLRNNDLDSVSFASLALFRSSNLEGTILPSDCDTVCNNFSGVTGILCV